MIYPKWRYHRTLDACIVHTPEADALLGDGWADTPAQLVEIDAEPAPEPEKKPTRKRKA